MAFAADIIALALCEIGSLAERRIAMLVDPALSGLPAFLTPRPGLNSGFMIAQVTAAALVSENKQRAYPASVDSIPTSANQEDHVSMAAHGARRLLAMADNVAGDHRHRAAGGRAGLRLPPAADLERARWRRARAALRARVPHLDDDRHLPPDIEAAIELVRPTARSLPDATHTAPARRRRHAMTDAPSWLTVQRGAAPLIVSFPHTGTDIPRDIEARLVSPWLGPQGRRLVGRPAL